MAIGGMVKVLEAFTKSTFGGVERTNARLKWVVMRMTGEEVEVIDKSFEIFCFEWSTEVSQWLKGSRRDCFKI